MVTAIVIVIFITFIIILIILTIVVIFVIFIVVTVIVFIVFVFFGLRWNPVGRNPPNWNIIFRLILFIDIDVWAVPDSS